MRTETKVGLFAFAAIVILTLGIVWKSSILLRATGYMLVGEFKTVNGLLPGAEVRYRGYLIGYVAKVKPNPQSIKVYMFVKRGVKISEGSRLRVDFDGLIGEKYLNVIPNPASEKYLKHGATLPGTAAAGIVDFVHIGTKNLEETKKILQVLRKIITSKDSQHSIQGLIININKVAEKLDSVLTKVDIMFDDQEVQNIGKNVSSVFDNINSVINNLNSLVLSISTNVDNQNVGEIMENLKQFSKQLNNLTDSIEGSKDSVMKDLGPIIKDVQETIENTKEISKTFRKSTGFLNATTVNVGAAVYSDASYEVGSRVDIDNSSIQLDIGNNNNKLEVKNIMYGKKVFKNILASIGLVEFSPGVKLEVPVGDNVVIENALYKNTNVTYKIKAKVGLLENIKGILGYEINKQNSALTFGLGIYTP